MLDSLLQGVGSLLGIGAAGNGVHGAPAPEIGQGLIGVCATIAALAAVMAIRWLRKSAP